MAMSSHEYRKKSESQRYVDTLREEYISKHLRVQERDELIYENNIEKRDVKGYHGREILELLQNADDAYQKSIIEGNKADCELEVLIEFKNNVLTVSNTGTVFDKDGIKSIVQGNISPKSGKYIGNKGTGFRSVLNWADEIRIHSGDFHVRFSKEIADEIFQRIKSERQIEKQLMKQPNLYIPMLAVPQNIEPYLKHNMTTIEIVVNPEKTQDDFGVAEQINNIDLRILLFLPNINRITIETEDKHISYEREVRKDEMKSVILRKYENSIIQLEEQFYVFEKVIERAIEEDGERKDIRLAIAVPKNSDSFIAGKIYSFFPLLDVETPFNCVMHATYILGDHRDTIIRNETNKTIVLEQLRFLVEVGEKFASREYGDTALRLLTPVGYSGNYWRFPPAFTQFALEEDYYTMLESAKILQTVNDEFISVKDSPKIFEYDFPSFFAGEEFRTLLKPIQDRNSATFIQSLSKRLGQSLIIEETYLLSVINKLANDWTTYQRIEVFCWWNQHYKKTLPRLLKTKNGSWLQFGQECFFLVGDFSNSELPSWVNVPSLDSEYQQVLFEYSEQLPDIQRLRENDKQTHISRLISHRNIYPLVIFTYRDRNNIISTVNSSVDSYSKSIDFVKWLWKNYGGEEDNWLPPKGSEQSPIRYNFPNAKDKKVQSSQKLFFGRAYGRELTEKLFDETHKAFPSPDVFSIGKEETEQFVDFISKFGVKKFPVIETQEIKQPLDSYAAEYERIIRKNEGIGPWSPVYIEYRLPYIDRLEDILRKFSKIEIMRWIYEDFSLRSYLSNPYYSGNAEIKYITNRQRYYRVYNGQIKNYIKFIFNEIKWFEINGIKYAPRQIVKDIYSRNNKKFSDLVPILDVGIVKEMAHEMGIDYHEVIKLLELFDFCDKITDLDSDDFYSLMLRIPDYDFEKSVDLSKTIYRIIEQSSFTRAYEDSENKKIFFQAGKLLVKYKGKYQYYLAKESYLPSAKIINKQNVPIVEKGQRTNNENFIRTFGCKQYDKEYTIQKETISESKSNPSFQLYFSEFLKYARAYGERNDNFERDIRKLSIILVDRISIIENNELIKIEEEYTCIRESSTNWYITVFGDNYDINQISEIIENICANIANTPGFESGKLGELFRAKEKSDREFLIRKEFGTLDVIDDKHYINDVRNNFIETVKKINKEYPINKIDIDFDNFSCMQNSEKLIKILSDIGTDVDQFRESGFVYTINLIPYFEAKLSKFINNERRRFKNILYTMAVNDKNLQNTFLTTIMRFENYKVEKCVNSVYFDVESAIKNSFPILNYKFKDSELLDADTEYRKNYELLNPNRLFEDEISNDINVQQIIYFNKSKEFTAWLEKQKNAQRLNINETEDPYSKYRDLIPEKGELIFREPSWAKNINNGKVNGVYNQSFAERRDRNQKVIGNKGELIVYNLLCKQFGKENVYPKSEAFVELGILKAGQASSGRYDLSYKDENGTEYFVEVKTSDGKSFIITPDELAFANQNSDFYKLFLIYDINCDPPKYIELPFRFWEDERFRKTEIIEKIVFEF